MRSFVKRIIFNLVMIIFFCQIQASVTIIVNREKISGIPTLQHFNWITCVTTLSNKPWNALVNPTTNKSHLLNYSFGSNGWSIDVHFHLGNLNYKKHFLCTNYIGGAFFTLLTEAFLKKNVLLVSFFLKMIKISFFHCWQLKMDATLFKH